MYRCHLQNDFSVSVLDRPNLALQPVVIIGTAYSVVINCVQPSIVTKMVNGEVVFIKYAGKKSFMVINYTDACWGSLARLNHGPLCSNIVPSADLHQLGGPVVGEEDCLNHVPPDWYHGPR